MTDDDRRRFITALMMVAETFNQPLSDARVEAYWIALNDLSPEEFECACHAAMTHAKFFPVPAILREYAEGTLEQQADDAWQLYKRAAREISGYGSPALPAALADTILAVFGSWQNACWKDFSDEMWASKRKEFARTFLALRRRYQSGEIRRLAGAFERDRIERPEVYVNRTLGDSLDRKTLKDTTH